MQQSICRAGAHATTLAVLMLVASSGTAAAQEYAGREKLRAQSNEFRKEVIRVADGVYVAVGYSASNVILIQGDSGSIIVDTSTDPVDARAIRTAFGNLLAAPVRAIIYTHSHPDHTGGARVFHTSKSSTAALIGLCAASTQTEWAGSTETPPTCSPFGRPIAPENWSA